MIVECCEKDRNGLEDDIGESCGKCGVRITLYSEDGSPMKNGVP